jgi:hypothetical protein
MAGVLDRTGAVRAPLDSAGGSAWVVRGRAAGDGDGMVSRGVSRS